MINELIFLKTKKLSDKRSHGVRKQKRVGCFIVIFYQLKCLGDLLVFKLKCIAVTFFESLTLEFLSVFNHNKLYLIG